MALSIGGGSINVRPNDRAFIIKEMLCDCFTIGDPSGSDYYLKGIMVGADKDFLFNGRLFLPSRGSHGTIIDNFPKGPAPKGWIKRPNLTTEGYALVDDTGLILFGYEVLDGIICHVTVNIFAHDGSLVAATSERGFTIYKAPANIGTGGILIT